MKKSIYDKMMEESNERMKLNRLRNYKHCKNVNNECCTIFSACADCYYFQIDLICPSCEREIPNEAFLNKDKLTCKWCKVEKL